MNKALAVFRNQLALFLNDKGMLIFYSVTALLVGICVPLFSQDISSSLSTAALLTTILLIPILADGLAGEREKKTLESLLSTPIKGRSIVWGKFLLSLLFATVFFLTSAFASVLSCLFLKIEINFETIHWLLIGLFAIFHFVAIILCGLYQSALSENTRMGYSKIALAAFPLGILFSASITILTTTSLDLTLMVSGILLLMYLVISLFFATKIAKFRQHSYFENLHYKKKKTNNQIYTDKSQQVSQFGAVFTHEMRYLATLKTLLLNFLLLCFAPAVVCFLSEFYLGEMNLNYAVLLTALMMPRTPTNLIAYSIGGEKTYKTAESLLSTPLNIRPMFLAKMMVPVLISTAMLIISSTFTLVVANLVGQELYTYSIEQIILLFPAGILSCISMVLITGILSARMKKPRNGLYVSTTLGLIFVLPPLAIVYLASDKLLWSLVYCSFMLVANIICFIRINDKISRPQLMQWI